MTNIRDIAKLSGTSIATVSRVLNRSGYVSDAVRAKVEAAVEAAGYRPNAGARLIRTQESRMIGVMLPALDLHFFGILAHEVEQALFQSGYRALICSTAEDPAREAHYVDALLSQQVDGVLAVAVTGQTAAYGRLRDAGIPIVAIDRDMPGLTEHGVRADHAAGMRMAAGHLLALGHRRFAIIGAPGHSAPIQTRLAGARAPLDAAGLTDADIGIGIGGVHTFEACRDLMLDLFARGHRPTAILGTTDIAAIGAIHAVYQQGLRVPQDVSVTGFDDLPAARYVVPQLTTVAQPIRAIGRQAVATLLALIAGAEPPAPPEGALALKMVLRGTTGPAPRD